MAINVKAGSYVGNGSDPQTISGVGFQPKVVMIFATTGTTDSNASVFKTADMSTGSSGVTSNMGENGQQSSGLIDSFTSDGFVVRGTTTGKNVSGVTYYYLALGGSGVVTGTYTGNGSDNRSITGIGFQPKWVIVQGSNNHTVHKTAASGNSTDTAHHFTEIADLNNAIQALQADGFQVGTDLKVNNSGTTYYYAAMSDTNLATGTYTGNGSDNRNITGVGFNPIAVLIKQSSTAQARSHSGNSGDSSNFMRANNAPAADAIQSLISDGFQIGTHSTVNNNGSTYYWIAFGASSTAHTKTLTEAPTATATFSRAWTLARTLTEAKTATASIIKTATKRLVEAVTGADTFTKGLIIASGPRSPGTMTQSTNDGLADWSNPNNAKISDNSDASAILDAGSLITLTEDLIATNFGFSIPTTATIDGILLQIERARDSGGDSVNDSEVRLIKGGSEVAANKATGTDWGTTDTYASYGGSTDLWGTTWTPNDINASNFGAMLVATSSGANSANVDHIRITVYYTQPGNSYTQTYTEAATAAASFIKATTRAVAESVSATATFSRLWTVARSYTEAATAAAVILKTSTRTATETASASDNLTALRTIPATLSEALTAAASLVRSAVRQFAEAATAADTFTGLRGLFPTFTEAAVASATMLKTTTKRLSDTVQATVAIIRSAVRTLSDGATAEDTFTGLRFRSATLSEAATAVAAVVRTTTRTLTEGISAAATFVGAFARILTEAATATDAITTVRHYARTLSEAITASDTFARAVTYARSLVEAVTATDTVRRLLNGVAVIWGNIARVAGSAFSNRSRNSATWAERDRGNADWDNRPRNHY
jgi:hypothetical protein